MPHSIATRATLLFVVLVAMQSVQAQPQQPECCFDATCATCELISDCIAGSGPFSPADVAEIGGTAVCGVGSNVLCSTWWENNTEGVTNGNPASPTNPGGCLVPCSDSNACNFDEIGECEYLTCAGCTNPNACNYNDQSTVDNGTCEFITDFQGSFSGMDYIAERENQLYFLSNAQMTWPEAEALALGIGGHLVCIESSEEQAFLDLNFDTSSGANELWIGLYQDTNSPLYAENDGGWAWSNGAPLDYTNWEASEPSGGTAENYARYLSNDLWGDYINGGIHRAIIEVDGCQIETTGPVDSTSSVVLYFENFESFPDYYGLRNGGNSGGYDGSETEWTLAGDPSTLTEDSDYFSVETIAGDKNFSGRDLDGEFIWTSKAINIIGYHGLSFTVELEEEGALESDDHIKLYYVKDDDSEVLISELTDDFDSATLSEDAFESSTSLRFRFKVKLNGGLENYRFDDLLLQGSPCTGGNIDGDGLCDDSDNCSDVVALNFADPNNPECEYEVFYEPFTDDSQFTKNVDFSHDGVSDYWGIYDPIGNTDDFDGNAGQPSGVGSFNGIDGNFLVGEDMNSAPILAVPGILSWSNIDISSFNADLTFELDIAEHGATSDEYVELYAKLSSDSDYTLLIDPGGSIGLIGNTLTKQTALGTFDGTSLDIQLRMYSDDGSDEVAVDDLRVLGTSNCNLVTVVADSPTFSLDETGSISVTAGQTAGAGITVSSTGDCFLVSSYEVSKTNNASGFAPSVSFDCSETGAQTVFVRATDGVNTSLPTAATITIQDISSPSVPVVNVSNIELGADGTVTLPASTCASESVDNCSSQGLVYLVSVNPTSGFATALDLDCTDLGELTLYCRAQDASGNQSASSLAADGAFMVVDNTAPQLSVQPVPLNLTGASISLGIESLGAFVEDACDPNPSLELSKDGVNWAGAIAYDCSELGSNILFVRALDASGNVTVELTTAMVTDSQAPSISAVSPTSIMLNPGSLDAMLSVSGLNFTAFDNCSQANDLIFLMSTLENGPFTASFPLSCSSVGPTTFYFKAIDSSGNESLPFAQTIEVLDATNLQAIGQDLTVSLDPSGFWSFPIGTPLIDNGSQGNCGSFFEVNPHQFSCNDLGPNEVTLTVTDGVNSDQTTVTVTVVDDTPPNFTSVPNFSISLNAAGQGLLTASDLVILANPADACASNEDILLQIRREGEFSFSPSLALNCADIGTPFNVEVRASDPSGNSTTSLAIPVTVSDEIAPTVSSIAPELSTSIGGNGLATIAAFNCMTASDNCGSSSLIYEMSETSGSGFATILEVDCNDVGSKTFYFRVTDASGNVSAEDSGTISIIDDLPPLAAAQDVSLSLLDGSVSLPASQPSFNISTDNCGIATSEIKLSSSPNDIYASSITFNSYGIFDVELRLTDDAGNVSSTLSTVTVTSVLYSEDFEEENPENPGNLCAPNYAPEDGNWSLPCADGRLSLAGTNDTVLLIEGPVSAADNTTTTTLWNSAQFEVGNESQLLLKFDAQSEGGLENSGLSSDEFKLIVIRDFVEDETPIVMKSGHLSGLGDGSITTVDSSFTRAIDATGSSQLSLRLECRITSSLADAYSVNNFVVCADSNGNLICDHEESGCMDSSACNYDSSAVTDDGTCFYANSDGICEAIIGCTDPLACNYNLEANVDDGSCSDEDACGVCGGNGTTWEATTNPLEGSLLQEFTLGASSAEDVASVNIELSGIGGTEDNWASDLIVAIVDPSGNGVEWGGYDVTTFAAGYAIGEGWPDNWNEGIEANSPFNLSVDLSDYGLSGSGTWTLLVANGYANSPDAVVYDLALQFDELCEATLGCTDPLACNYDSTAVEDDGSCIDPDPVLGCCSTEVVLEDVLSGGAFSDTLSFEAEGAPFALGVVLDWTDLLPDTDDPDASDLLLTITDPNGNCASFGGFDVSVDGCASVGDNAIWPDDWNVNEANYAQYTDTLSLDGTGLEGSGTWSIVMGNGWSESGPVSYGLSLALEGLCFLSSDAEGCTDQAACNFDDAAVVDDGSCVMPDPISGCTCAQSFSQSVSLLPTDTLGTPAEFLGSGFPGPTLLEVELDFTNIEANPNSWPSDMVVRILSPDSNCLWFGGWDANTPPLGCSESDELNVYWPASWYTPNSGQYSAAVDLSDASIMPGTGQWSVTMFNGWSGATNGGMTSNPVTYDLDWVLTGVCDIAGCTDEDAFNYLAVATQDDGSCIYGGCTDGDDFDTANGDFSPIADNYDPTADIDDGSCQYSGCDDGAACNYEEWANLDDGSCNYSCYGCTYELACNYDPAATINDDSCDLASCSGCTDPCASNFDPTATIDDGSCSAVIGCMDNTACNYNTCAEFNVGCVYADEDCESCSGQTDGSGVVVVEDTDGDGVCDALEIEGCTDLETPACNYDPAATDEDGSCEYCSCVGVAGCTYPAACNFSEAATEDDGTCTFPMTGLDCNGDCLLDTDEDGTCDEAEIPGCTDPLASNHHPAATEDDGTCTFGNGSCPADVDGDSVVGVADILNVLSSFGSVCTD